MILTPNGPGCSSFFKKGRLFRAAKAFSRRKDSGICLRELGAQDTDLEPDLISGFLSAIQSFGTELSKEEVPMKKIAYKNLEIELYLGETTICALLARGEITAHLSALLKQGGLPALWLAFLSALAGIVGAVIAETRRIRTHSSH